MNIKTAGTNDFPGEYKPILYKLKYFPAFLAVLIIGKQLFLLYLDKIKKQSKRHFQISTKNHGWSHPKSTELIISVSFALFSRLKHRQTSFITLVRQKTIKEQG